MNSNEQLKDTTIKSLFWKFFERMGAQIIQFVISVVLARILMPEDFGAVALVTVFVQVANVFVQSGLSTALIRKINSDDLDASTVFYFSLVVSIVIYFILFFCAPLIANFYKMPVLKNVLRVLALTIIVGTYNSMQNTMLAKKMLFKKLFISSFSSVLVSGVIGIVMALAGCGIWAIVGQQLSAIIITTIVMLFTVKWYPKWMFSFKRLKKLFGFGWKLLFSGLLDVVYNNIYSLIIGKKYSSGDLAYWNRGEQFPNVLVANINGSISSVMFPVFSQKQDNKAELKSMVRRSIKLSAYLVFPMMMGLAMCAEPVIRLLLGEKWLFAVPFLQGWCFCYALMPIHTTNLQVYNALGRSDVFLGLEIAKKVVGILILFITLPFGLEWMMFGCMIRGILGGIINAAPNIKILKYSIREQILDLLPTILVTAIMGSVVYGCSFIPMHYVIVLIIQVLVGVIVYFGLSALLKQESFVYVWSFIRKIIKKRQNKKINNAAISENKDEAVEGNSMKKILLLGGSEQQIVAIEKAKDLGYYTILCDYLSDNPGQYHADKFYLASTTDKELILNIAKENNVDGVLAYASDPAAPTAAYVAEKLGLPTSPYESVDILTDKGKFRKFLSNNGFCTPKANDYTDYDTLVTEFNTFKLPVIIKPVDSSGSKGVSRIDSIDELKDKFDNAMNFSRAKRVIVEEYVEAYKYQIAGDGFSWNGELVFRCFGNDHFDEKSKNPFVPISASFPFVMPEEVHQKIHDTIQRLLTLLNMKTCCYNFDIRIDSDLNVYLMEIGPRDGGNYIPQLIEYGTGVNLVELACRSAVGEDCSHIQMVKQEGFYAYYSVHSYKTGELISIDIDPEVETLNIVENHIIAKPGDMVKEYSGSNTTLGILLMKFNSMEQMLDMMDHAEKWITVKVED